MLEFVTKYLKIFSNIINIEVDKLLHIIAGIIITITFFILTDDYMVTLTVSTLIAFIKEIYDYLHPEKHTCDLMDALATIGASTITLVVTWIIGTII